MSAGDFEEDSLVLTNNKVKSLLAVLLGELVTTVKSGCEFAYLLRVESANDNFLQLKRVVII